MSCCRFVYLLLYVSWFAPPFNGQHWHPLSSQIQFQMSNKGVYVLHIINISRNLVKPDSVIATCCILPNQHTSIWRHMSVVASPIWSLVSPKTIQTPMVHITYLKYTYSHNHHKKNGWVKNAQSDMLPMPWYPHYNLHSLEVILEFNLFSCIVMGRFALCICIEPCHHYYCSHNMIYLAGLYIKQQVSP